VAKRDARERVRLLYVGFTRARDHLIVAVPSDAKGKPRLDWLNELRNEQGPLLTLPAAEDTPQVTVRGAQQRTAAFAARVWSVASDETRATVQVPPTSVRWFMGAPRVNVRSRFAIRPSSALDDGLTVPDAQDVSQVRLTSRMPFTQPANATWDQVGTALHAF